MWAAVAIPAAAYILRSLQRHTFAPDLPADAIVAGVLATTLLLARWYGARRGEAEPRRGDGER